MSEDGCFFFFCAGIASFPEASDSRLPAQVRLLCSVSCASLHLLSWMLFKANIAHCCCVRVHVSVPDPRVCVDLEAISSLLQPLMKPFHFDQYICDSFL